MVFRPRRILIVVLYNCEGMTDGPALVGGKPVIGMTSLEKAGTSVCVFFLRGRWLDSKGCYNVGRCDTNDGFGFA